MKQKNYSFEHVDGASDHVELHRSRGQRFHLFAKLVCLLLAIVFWLIVRALGTYPMPIDQNDADAAQPEDNSVIVDTDSQV